MNKYEVFLTAKDDEMSVVVDAFRTSADGDYILFMDEKDYIVAAFSSMVFRYFVRISNEEK